MIQWAIYEMKRLLCSLSGMACCYGMARVAQSWTSWFWVKVGRLWIAQRPAQVPWGSQPAGHWHSVGVYILQLELDSNAYVLFLSLHSGSVTQRVNWYAKMELEHTVVWPIRNEDLDLKRRVPHYNSAVRPVPREVCSDWRDIGISKQFRAETQTHRTEQVLQNHAVWIPPFILSANSIICCSSTSSSKQHNRC